MTAKSVLRWLGSNAEAVIGLTIAVVVGVAGLVDLASAKLVNSAVLITLAALSLALIRDHWGRERDGPEVRSTLDATQRALAELPARFERIERANDVITDARAAIGEASMMRLMVGAEISSALSDARRRTSLWMFKGGTGTFFRAVTVPECVNAARRDRRSLNIQLEILDPRDEGLCTRYAEYFRSLVDDPNEDELHWDCKGTQQELYATILAMCHWQQRYRPMKLGISLSSTMTTFRWDLTSDYLVITERGPSFPAILIESGRFYYDYWRSELEVSFDQGYRPPLELAGPLSDVPTVAETRDLFAGLGVDLPEGFHDRDVEVIIESAVHAKNPYA